VFALRHFLAIELAMQWLVVSLLKAGPLPIRFKFVAACAAY